MSRCDDRRKVVVEISRRQATRLMKTGTGLAGKRPRRARIAPFVAHLLGLHHRNAR